MRKSKKNCLLFFIFLILFSLANKIAADEIPDQLKPWIPWVKGQDKTRLCPKDPEDKTKTLCIWPYALNLDISDKKGDFSIKWEVFAEAALPLPGSLELMPQNVLANKKAQPVLIKDKKPFIYLEAGKYEISGSFNWEEIPDTMEIPPEIVNLSLSKNKVKLDSIQRDEKNRIWLKTLPPEKKTAKNHTDLKIYRKVKDGHPVEIESRLDLSVFGQARQEIFNIPMPEKAKLVLIDSPLLISTSKEGLIIDLKPGNFKISFKHILSGKEDSIEVPERKENEIWSFEEDNEFRSLNFKGGKSIDPKLTNLPQEWKDLSAYLLLPEDRIFLETRKELKTKEKDNIYLEREIWLDFKGRGLSIKDEMRGNLKQRSYMGMKVEDKVLPGRITYKNEDRLITEFKGLRGLEIPPGPFALRAVSRMEDKVNSNKIPLGWERAVESLNIRLNLPPGWHLFSLSGGELVKKDSVLSRWTTLDFFFLILLTSAAFKLWGPLSGLCFAAGLALFHHSFAMPLFFWFSLLITRALGSFFISADTPLKLYRLISFIHILLLITAGLMALPYIGERLKTAFYPQLEEQRQVYQTGIDRAELLSSISLKSRSAPTESMRLMKEPESRQNFAMAVDARTDLSQEKKKEEVYRTRQTGKGLPDWQWQRIDIKTGFTEADHYLKLYLISPFLNSITAVLQSFFLILVLAHMIKGFPFKLPRVKAKEITGLIFLISFSLPLTVRADFPPSYLLEELKSKIEKEDICVKDCLRSGIAEIKLDSAKKERPELKLSFELHAAKDSVFTLPHTDIDLSSAKILLENRELPLLYQNGQRFIMLPRGIHKLKISKTLENKAFYIDFISLKDSLRPDQVKLDAPGWQIEGFDNKGRLQGTLFFNSPEEEKKELKEAKSSAFAKINRKISHEREWKIKTSLRRAYPGKDRVSINIPLIEGESVLKETFLPDAGYLKVDLPEYGRVLTWESRLKEDREELSLLMPQGMDFSEIWEFTGDTDRHLDFSGTAKLIKSENESMIWQPLPGDYLNIRFSSLPSAPGEIINTEKLHLKYKAGRKKSELELKALIRSGKAAEQVIIEPENSRIREIFIGNERINPDKKDRELKLSLPPGEHNLKVIWELEQDKNAFLPRCIKMPELDLGMSVANTLQEVQLERQEWLLWTFGPVLGPGVCIWGWFILVLAAAILLGLKAEKLPLKTRDWLLLGLGLVAFSPLTIFIVVGGFFIINWYQKQKISNKKILIPSHIAFSFLILVMSIILISAVKNGLSGVPDMQIWGNKSNSTLLRWSSDLNKGINPDAGVFLLPILYWRIFMFFWALWLASKVISWAPWVFKAFFKDER